MGNHLDTSGTENGMPQSSDNDYTARLNAARLRIYKIQEAIRSGTITDDMISDLSAALSELLELYSGDIEPQKRGLLSRFAS